MGRRVRTPLRVVCGSSVEGGHAMFWAVDLSDSRMFCVPERLRKDILLDRLFDFLGKDLTSPVLFSLSVISKRGEEILEFVNTKMTAAKQEGALPNAPTN